MDIVSDKDIAETSAKSDLDHSGYIGDVTKAIQSLNIYRGDGMMGTNSYLFPHATHRHVISNAWLNSMLINRYSPDNLGHQLWFQYSHVVISSPAIIIKLLRCVQPWLKWLIMSYWRIIRMTSNRPISSSPIKKTIQLQCVPLNWKKVVSHYIYSSSNVFAGALMPRKPLTEGSVESWLHFR